MVWKYWTVRWFKPLRSCGVYKEQLYSCTVVTEDIIMYLYSRLNTVACVIATTLLYEKHSYTVQSRTLQMNT